MELAIIVLILISLFLEVKSDCSECPPRLPLVPYGGSGRCGYNSKTMTVSDTSSGTTCEITVSCFNSRNKIAIQYSDRQGCSKSNFASFKFRCIRGNWAANTAYGYRSIDEIYCDGGDDDVTPTTSTTTTSQPTTTTTTEPTTTTTTTTKPPTTTTEDSSCASCPNNLPVLQPMGTPQCMNPNPITASDITNQTGKFDITCQNEIRCLNPSDVISIRFADTHGCVDTLLTYGILRCMTGSWSVHVGGGRYRPVDEFYCHSTTPPLTTSPPTEPITTTTEPTTTTTSTTSTTTTTTTSTTTTEEPTTTTTTTTTTEEPTTTQCQPKCASNSVTILKTNPPSSKDFDIDQVSEDCKTRSFTCSGDSAFIQVNDQFIVEEPTDDPNNTVVELVCSDSGEYTLTKLGTTVSVTSLECIVFAEEPGCTPKCNAASLAVLNNDPDNGSKDFNSDEITDECKTRTFTCEGEAAYIEVNGQFVIADPNEPNKATAVLQCNDSGQYTFTKGRVTAVIRSVQCFTFANKK